MFIIMILAIHFLRKSKERWVQSYQKKKNFSEKVVPKLGFERWVGGLGWDKGRKQK